MSDKTKSNKTKLTLPERIQLQALKNGLTTKEYVGYVAHKANKIASFGLDVADKVVPGYEKPKMDQQDQNYLKNQSNTLEQYYALRKEYPVDIKVENGETTVKEFDAHKYGDKVYSKLMEDTLKDAIKSTGVNYNSNEVAEIRSMEELGIEDNKLLKDENQTLKFDGEEYSVNLDDEEYTTSLNSDTISENEDANEHQNPQYVEFSNQYNSFYNERKNALTSTHNMHPDASAEELADLSALYYGTEIGDDKVINAFKGLKENNALIVDSHCSEYASEKFKSSIENNETLDNSPENKDVLESFVEEKALESEIKLLCCDVIKEEDLQLPMVTDDKQDLTNKAIESYMKQSEQWEEFIQSYNKQSESHSSANTVSESDEDTENEGNNLTM